ncbi:MAG: hypothetical protein JKY23_03485 [Nitrospinaceae bacterium]|nr:hypothetical protein [Nitrospinaceae bacterium]
MADYFLSGEVEIGSQLYIAPLTSSVAAANNISTEDSVGYFLYQKHNGDGNGDISILAKVQTEEAAFELSRILGLS